MWIKWIPNVLHMTETHWTKQDNGWTYDNLKPTQLYIGKYETINCGVTGHFQDSREIVIEVKAPMSVFPTTQAPHLDWSEF